MEIEEILEQFDKKFVTNKREDGEDYTKYLRDSEIKSFLTTSIHQAIAEEKERVREEVTAYWVNKHQDDLRLQEVLALSSLNKPLDK